MDNLLDNLSGIERVKYLKALIEKVNNIGSKYTSGTHLPPPKSEPQSCSACASKTKRFLLECSRNSDKIELKRTKPITQKCDVHRLKFVKHQNNENRNSASKCDVKAQRRQRPTEIKTFEATRDASFEAEKRYLRQIYSRKPTNEVDDHRTQQKPTGNVGIKKGYEDETESDVAAFCQLHSTKDDTHKNIGSMPQQRSPTINTQQDQPEYTDTIVVERGRDLINDGSVANRNRSVAVTNAQQPISNPRITLNSNGTRRIVSHLKFYKSEPRRA